jgi:putative NIF3 family GTP cyclohydrolase 1 type 2
VIDIGHFESERIIVQHLARRLDAQLKSMGRAVRIEEAACEVTPFRVL